MKLLCLINKPVLHPFWDALLVGLVLRLGRWHSSCFGWGGAAPETTGTQFGIAFRSSTLSRATNFFCG